MFNFETRKQAQEYIKKNNLKDVRVVKVNGLFSGVHYIIESKY